MTTSEKKKQYARNALSCALRGAMDNGQWEKLKAKNPINKG
jgi:hypothetical protein